MISGPWGHDRTWERCVVEQIKRGGAAPRTLDLGSPTYWDPSGVAGSYAGGWEHAEARSKGAIRTNAVYLSDEAIAARALQRKLLREGIREALAEARERQKKITADRLAEAAARREARRVWDLLRAERERKKREQEEAWLEEDKRRRNEAAAEAAAKWVADKSLHERERILGSKWVCTVCGGASGIKRDDEGYRITCIKCGKSAWGSHASLWGIVSR